MSLVLTWILHIISTLWILTILYISIGPSLLTALKKFKDVIIPTYSSCFSHDSFLDHVKYTKETIFQHFYLYQFVLTQPQMADTATIELDVEIPERNILSLEEGIPKDDWTRMKKQQELEEEYEKKRMELETSETSAMLQVEEKLKEVYKTQLEKFTDGGPQKIAPEELSIIVSNMAEAHIGSTQVMMSQGLLKQEVDLTFRLDQLELLSTQQKENTSAKSKSASTSYSKDSANQGGQKT